MAIFLHWGISLTKAAALSLLLQAGISVAAPNGFPASGNGLWYRTEGTYWVLEWLPVGNGYMAGQDHGHFIMCSLLTP